MSAVLVQESVTREVIGAFYAVYNALGFGFLEAVYANALALELTARGRVVDRELPIDVRYRGASVGFYRADVVVDKVVLIEIKSARILDPHVRQQALNYLRGTRLEVALILHFGPKPHFERLISTR